MKLEEPPFLLSAYYRDSGVLFAAFFEPITYTKILFCAGNKGRLNKAFRLWLPGEMIPEDHSGSCIPIDEDCHGEHFCLYLGSADFAIDTVALATHETTHLVDFIFDVLGVPPGKESTEFRAHLTEFIMSAILRLLFPTPGHAWRINSTAPDNAWGLYSNIVKELKSSKSRNS